MSSHLELQKSFRMTRGFPFGTIGNEVTENDELIRQDLCIIFEVVRSKLSAFFIGQKAKGSIARTADARALADFCIATVQGAMLMGKIERGPRPLETTLAETLRHLRQRPRIGAETIILLVHPPPSHGASESVPHP